MAADRELTDFIEKALTRGASKAEIERVLREAGWPHDRVEAALGAFSDIEFVVPVPRPRPYLSARDAFLYLVLFAALGFTAYHLASLLFSIIDIAFPDPAVRGDEAWRATDMRWDIAFLVVAFPLYLFLASKTSAEAARDAEKRASRVRKWLTYVALGVAAVCLVGDLVALIFMYLNGDLTIRVALRILVVAVIAAAVFWYYLKSMARDERAR